MNKKQKNSDKSTIYDVFLSYNSNERNAVEQIAAWLKSNKIRVWFDKWELRPGLPWQDAIENAIIESKCTAVFLGSSGLGPWEIPEMRASLMEHVERGRPVIPVLLPGCRDTPELPIFLKGHTWVDFREGIYNQESQRNLLWGITGEKPNFVQESA